MPKTPITKDRLSITLDKELLDFIKEQCDERTMKVSSYIEKLIKIGVDNEKRK